MAAAARSFGCGISQVGGGGVTGGTERLRLASSTNNNNNNQWLPYVGGNSPVAAQRRGSLRVSACAAEAKPAKKLSGLMKPRPVSPELQDIVGVPEISRAGALKLLWAHIKQNNLQTPSDKRIIVCDEKLKKIFGGRESVKFLEIGGLITPHFL